MAVITFEDAVKDSGKYSKRHLLLGNGFSIACRPDIFHYGSLFSQADFSGVPEVTAVFEALQTQDFELAIKALESAMLLLPVYVAAPGKALETMKEHAAALKEILIETIAANHPHVPAEISDEEFLSCRRFLSYFVGANDGQIYSLNYDLLLYWALMHEDAPLGEAVQLEKNDGFGNVEDDPDTDYVVWQGETAAHSASIHFLHGALHLFDAGTELKKYTWIRKGVPLVEQARAAMDAGAFPLFVAEGSSVQKKDKIRHNAYLYQGLKQLTANANQGKHCFFVFGHSLAENDDHILKRLGRARFPCLYVGVYGDPGSVENKKIMDRAVSLALLRQDRWPLEIKFYDAATAHVWR